MSALKPKNNKYHGIWRIFGHQLAHKDMCEAYRNGYDEVAWDKEDKLPNKEVSTRNNGMVKVIRFK